MSNSKISVEDLDKLEEKYYSPVHVLSVSTDDAGPIYILKEGKSASKKITNMHGDINMLIRELRKCVT